VAGKKAIDEIDEEEIADDEDFEYLVDAFPGDPAWDRQVRKVLKQDLVRLEKFLKSDEARLAQTGKNAWILKGSVPLRNNDDSLSPYAVAWRLRGFGLLEYLGLES
jgi:hypothetical protein